MADEGRSEKPTKRRLEKARREGQFPASREFLAGLQFLTFVILAGVGGAHFLERGCEMARYFLAAAFRIQLTPHEVVSIYRAALGHIFMPLLWMGLCLTSISLAGQLGSTRLGLSFQKLAPDLKRLEPAAADQEPAAAKHGLLPSGVGVPAANWVRGVHHREGQSAGFRGIVARGAFAGLAGSGRSN